MVFQQGVEIPHLVVLSPDAFIGRRIELAADYMVVGREQDCDVRFDDPHVSRTHAALQRRGNAVYVQDLGSSGGTFVNGSPAAMTELRGGDVVTFATVRARFDAPQPGAEETRAMPVQAAAPQAATPQAATPQAERVPGGPVPAEPAHYSIGRQDGEVISNVGHDQYNAYVQHIVQQRDDFLREIAATKTKARWLVWIGFVLFVAGSGLFAAADLNFMKQVSNAVQSQHPQPTISNPFGRDIGGIPSGLLGWAIAAVGVLLLGLGIVLHIVATSRRRRVDRELPLPAPWPYGGPPGPSGRVR